MKVLIGVLCGIKVQIFRRRIGFFRDLEKRCDGVLDNVPHILHKIGAQEVIVQRAYL